MKRIPITLLAAIAMTAVSATAQHLRGGRNVREGAVVVRTSPGALYRASRYTVARPTPRCSTMRCTVLRRVPARRSVTGYYRTVCEPVLVEAGHWHTEVIPPSYGWVYDRCGHRHWGIVEPGGSRRVWCPPRYENRTRRVWVAY